MKSPTPPPTGGFRPRSYPAILCLLAAALGLATWHFRHRDGQPSDPTQVIPGRNPALEAAATPLIPASTAQRTGPDRAVAGQPANVQLVMHPEESPEWAVPYGAEFWRLSAPPSASPKGDTNPAPSFNIGEVIERVSHAFAPPDAGALPQVQARTYTARFDEDAGLGFSPHRPAASQAVAPDAGPAAEDGIGANQSPSRGSRRHRVPSPTEKPQPDPHTEAWFRTVAVSRDGQALFTAGADTPPWLLLGNTAQGLLNPAAGLVAHYEARTDGIETTWMLPQAPAGAGPLVVEAELSGLTYAGQTEHGLHYADPAGVARVRVGPVTVVDAAGARWNLAMAAAGNRLRIEVPADILAQATYPLAIDPALEAEFEMDKRVIALSDGDQGSPSVAAGSNGYLVVWYDQRTEKIGGARVTTGGQVSDPMGLPIQTTGAGQDPAVAAGSSGYLVVWDVYRSVTNDTSHDVYGARVTTTGVISDTNGIVICNNAGSQPLPSVAASGSGYLVVWGDQRNHATTGYDIYGARVTTAGVVSDPHGFAISTAVNDQSSPSVTASQSDYLVVWEDHRTGSEIYGARVTTAGVVSDPNGIAICPATSGQHQPSVAANGNGYFVVWEDDRNRKTTRADIYGARVTTAGAILDPDGFAISIAVNDQSSPSVAAGGNGYLVVWTDNRGSNITGGDIYGARVTTVGVILDPDGFAISTAAQDQFSPAVAASGSSYLVVWTDERNSAFATSDIYGARVTTAGTIADSNGIVISTAENDQLFASVAAGSNGYLVVWQDGRNVATTGYHIYGTRVTMAGKVSDPNGIAICTSTNDQYFPAVAASGSGYLVVWEDYRHLVTTGVDIYGARVTAAGLTLDPDGFAICTATNAQISASVASGGGGYLVAWEDDRNVGTTGVDIYGARVTSAGVILDPGGFAISTAEKFQTSPAVAASSNGYLVVWIDYRNSASIVGDIYGARVTTAGVVSDPNGIAISTATAHYHFSPKVAANGSGYLVVWEDERNSDTTSADIYGARVTTGGVVEDPTGIPICTLAGYQGFPSVAAAGTVYVVAWWDQNRTGLFWHRVDPAGQLLEITPLAINGSYGLEVAAAACSGTGRFLLASDRSRGAGIQAVSRVIGSLHTTNRPPPGPVLEFKSAGFTVVEDKAAATITVTASGNNPGLVAVNYATSDGTARHGADYEAQSGTLVFPKGTTQQTFRIPIATNTIHEIDRTVNLVLSNPGGGATLGLKHRAMLTIEDDDAGGALSLNAAAYSVRESTHTLTITVKRTGGKASGVTVAYETAGGTAVAGPDYTAQAGILSFGAREMSKTFTIPILDNVIKEGRKTFFINLFDPTGGATLGNVEAAIVTILDDD